LSGSKLPRILYTMWRVEACANAFSRMCVSLSATCRMRATMDCRPTHRRFYGMIDTLPSLSASHLVLNITNRPRVSGRDGEQNAVNTLSQVLHCKSDAPTRDSPAAAIQKKIQFRVSTIRLQATPVLPQSGLTADTF
jgi:hypothetical protein